MNPIRKAFRETTSTLTKYFFRGLLILIPVVVTVYVVYAVFGMLDPVFAWIGRQLPASWDLPDRVRSLFSIVVAVAVIVGIGMFASNFIGRRLVALLERLVEKLPVIKLLYSSVKDLLSAFVGDKKSFDRPVVVSLTGDGAAKVVGFVTQDSLSFLGVDGHVAVYLPQSYNFAGNLVLFPVDRVRPLAVSSSDVMTFLVSGGVSGRKNPQS